MVNKKNILAFLDYNYMPFSKAQCIKRALMVWAAGAALCLVNQPLKLWIAPLVITNVIVSMLFTALVAKFSQTQPARYLRWSILFVYGRAAKPCIISSYDIANRLQLAVGHYINRDAGNMHPRLSPYNAFQHKIREIFKGKLFKGGCLPTNYMRRRRYPCCASLTARAIAECCADCYSLCASNPVFDYGDSKC